MSQPSSFLLLRCLALGTLWSELFFFFSTQYFVCEFHHLLKPSTIHAAMENQMLEKFCTVLRSVKWGDSSGDGQLAYSLGSDQPLQCCINKQFAQRLGLATSQLCCGARFLWMLIQGLSDTQRKKAQIVPILRQYSTLYRDGCQGATKIGNNSLPYAPSKIVNENESSICIALDFYFISVLHEHSCLLILLG